MCWSYRITLVHVLVSLSPGLVRSQHLSKNSLTFQKKVSRMLLLLFWKIGWTEKSRLLLCQHFFANSVQENFWVLSGQIQSTFNAKLVFLRFPPEIKAWGQKGPWFGINILKLTAKTGRGFMTFKKQSLGGNVDNFLRGLVIWCKLKCCDTATSCWTRV